MSYMSNQDYNEIINVAITRDTWKKLNTLKEPGDSFNTVISRLISTEEAKLRTDQK